MKKKYTLFLGIYSCFWLLQISAFGQAEFIKADTRLPNHPRLLLLAGQESTLKNRAADPASQKVHQAILAESDGLLSEAPVERIQIGRRLLSKSREALRRVFFLSYAYRMTQDAKYLHRAEKELLAVSAFSDWNPSHFLDVAEMTMAVAIGYDWLFADLSPASKTTIKEAILKKGLEPSMDPKHNGWLRVTHNWNQVCNAGMTYGALAIYEDQPELARTIINRAIETMVLPMKDYAPHGAYPEGYGYWGYGTSFNVMFISAIEKAFGQDFGLSAQPGFLQTAHYLQHMTGPTGASFNYSDSHGTGEFQPAMFWFADKLEEPSVLWVERQHVQDISAEKLAKNRLLPATLVWSGSAGLQNLPEPQQKVWAGGGSMPVALMRTSWSDPAALFVGFKGGSASVNHAHMDVGSFVMEANGVRWAMDFAAQDYESLESKGLKLFGRDQNAQRWEIFRNVNQVHNTLTVNNQRQRVAGHAPLTGFSTEPNFLSASTDLSEVYQGALQKARRGIAIVDQAYVLVRDELETLDQETTVRWTMLTPAEVKIIGKNRAELTKDGKKLILQVQEPGNITWKTWSTDPPNDYDAPNPGTTLVGFELTVPAQTQKTLSVLLIPDTARKKPSKKTMALAKWPQKTLPDQ